MQPTPVLAAAHAGTDSLQPREARQEARVTSISAASSYAETEEQYLVVLTGLIGSGKSTFARALVEHFPTWVRCNQDELGDRHAVAHAARTALLANRNVVIDRTNIDAKQRRTWLELARDICTPIANPVSQVAPVTEVKTRRVVTVSLTLTIPIQVAEQRLRTRVSHETLPTPQEALKILPHFLRSYQKPSLDEGFDYLLAFPATKMSLHPSKDEVEAILFHRLTQEYRTPGVLPERPPPRVTGAARARGAASARGMARGSGRGRAASAVYTPHHHPYPPQQPQQLQAQQAASAADTPPLDTLGDAPPPSPSFAAPAPAPTSLLPPLAPQHP